MALLGIPFFLVSALANACIFQTRSYELDEEHVRSLASESKLEVGVVVGLHQGASYWPNTNLSGAMAPSPRSTTAAFAFISLDLRVKVRGKLHTEANFHNSVLNSGFSVIAFE